MAAEFVHLHVHSEYSLLDGAIPCGKLATLARDGGMPAIALTDNNAMFGAVTHQLACEQAEVGSIIGCEVNVVRPIGGKDGPLNHLVLLAETDAGYRNLLRIVSKAQISPAVEHKPSVRLDTIAADTEGLIALTGCMGGLFLQSTLEQGEGAGRDMLVTLQDIMPKGSLYVELQDHGFPEQAVLNEIACDLAGALDLPVVATNDCHFAERSDGEAQLYLSCIASGRAYADASAAHHGSFEMYVKSPKQMKDLFRHVPEAITNTLRVAERCSSFQIPLGTPMLPTFPVPDGFDTASYFRHVAHDGLDKRLAELRRAGRTPDESTYRARLDTEIGIILDMNFPGYFLIVWDFIRYAKGRSIPVGPGRGSGAGSLVAYSLRITDLDPIEHRLLFERFLNPERVSMPDFDIDFCMDRRDDVIQYVADKYGAESVGQIATFHELKARSVIKDVARAMGLPAQESQRIANLVPQKAPGIMYTIGEALDIEPKLKATIETDPQVAELIEQAQRLEGLTRHVGMHAAGVVISEGPLWDHVPCFESAGAIVTQYAKDEVELAGLVKFDFLGLKTLTVIDIAERLVNQRPDREGLPALDMSDVPLDDALTYKLLQSGETTGVFQLESSGMQQLFKDLRPDAFEDVVAAVALYRPGPLGSGMVKDFVDCKHGRKPIAKMHHLVDDVLAPTYGVIVYQEQVMQIAQRLAGYTLGGADVLRRAMGKKKPEEMAKQKSIFLDGARQLDVVEQDAERIFSLLEYFAGYGFNKSHSAAYALLCYQTGYLKAHYPVEFLCALLTADRDKTEKVVRFIAEGRHWGIEILPPDINQSKVDFTVVYGEGDASKRAQGKRPRFRDALRPQVRFGLGAIRGVGDSAVEAILAAREEGPFEDMFGFAQRVDARRINRGVLEAMVESGAFDALLEPQGITRARAFASTDRALERCRSASRDREAGQTSMFAMFQNDEAGPAQSTNEYVECSPWDLRELLRHERQALGFYVSGHPLDRYGVDLRRFAVDPTAGLSARDPWSRVRVAGTVEGYRERVFRSGDKIAFFGLEDLTGAVQCKARQRLLLEAGEVLASGEPVLIEGKLQFPMNDDGEPSDGGARESTLLVDQVTLLSNVIQAETRLVAIHLTVEDQERLARLNATLRQHPGQCPVQLVIETGEGRAAVLASKIRVAPADVMLSELERLFGRQVAELR